MNPMASLWQIIRDKLPIPLTTIVASHITSSIYFISLRVYSGRHKHNPKTTKWTSNSNGLVIRQALYKNSTTLHNYICHYSIIGKRTVSPTNPQSYLCVTAHDLRSQPPCDVTGDLKHRIRQADDTKRGIRVNSPMLLATKMLESALSRVFSLIQYKLNGTENQLRYYTLLVGIYYTYSIVILPNQVLE